MADRTNYYFRQRVSEAELDLGFELLERADRNLAADLGVYGVISGAEPSPHYPVADLTIDLTGPAKGYDHLGQRIFFGTGQRVDCSVDDQGLPTAVSLAGQERWLGVFLRFDRLLSDPRTDGNSQQVFFRSEESFQLVVRQGPQSPAGSAPKVALQPDELLLCDVRRTSGQTQVLAADIDTSRRQSFIFATGDAVSVVSSIWSVIVPAANTVQAALSAVDTLLSGHFGATSRRHAAQDINYTPHGFIGASNVKAALDEIADDLSSATSGTPGSSKVGADAVAGTPNALAAGTVDAQLSSLLSFINTHVGATTGAHMGTAISAATHAWVIGTTVQAQLQEIVSTLLSNDSSKGAAKVGNVALPGTPYALLVASVKDQIAGLLTYLNTHVGSSDHDGRYYNQVTADSRFYRVGSKVGDADTLDTRHAADFALAGHTHDSRYLFRSAMLSDYLDPGQAKDFFTVADRPDLVAVSYNYVDGNDMPDTTTFVQGLQTSSLRTMVTKVDDGGGGKDYKVNVHNTSSTRLYVNVVVYRVAS